MTTMHRKPLFYEAEIAPSALQLLVIGASLQAPVDAIDFPLEAGGTFNRQLALAYLPGMDSIQIDDARFEFRVARKAQEITGFHVSPGEGGAGAVLTLDHPARLRELILGYDDVPPNPGTGVRLIIRPIAGGKAGPPVLAEPHFAGPSPVFGPIMAGLTIVKLADGKHLVKLPDLNGTAWLFQVANGGKLEDLAPLNRPITIAKVTIAAEPRDVAVTIAGTPPTPLWSNPGTLAADSGVQQVSFLPIAQRRLSAALAEANKLPGTMTLPLSIDFSAASGGLLEVTELSLSGFYHANPLGTAPVRLTILGDPMPFALTAPAGLRPVGGTATLAVRMLGRAINAPAPDAVPNNERAGLRVGPDRLVACSQVVAAVPGGSDTAVCLVSAAFRADFAQATEIAVELRGDAAGVPGPVIAPSVIRKFTPEKSGWNEFSFPKPVAAHAGDTVWVVVRVTSGLAFWHAGAASAGAMQVSLDQGASWGVPATPLGPAKSLRAVLFHAESPPFARPRVTLLDGGTILAEDLLEGGQADDVTGKFWVATAAALPSIVLDRLAALAPPAGGGRASLSLRVASRSALELTLSDAALRYDPQTVQAR